MWCNYIVASHMIKTIDGSLINIDPETFVLRQRPELLHRIDLANNGLEYKGTLGWVSKNEELIVSLGKIVSRAISTNNHDLEAYGYQEDVYEAKLNVKHGPRHLHVLSVVGKVGERINPIPHFELIVSETNRILQEQRSPYYLPTHFNK